MKFHHPKNSIDKHEVLIFILWFYFYSNRHHSNRTNGHQSNNPHHAAHAHAAAAAHQAVNEAFMPFGGGAFSPFGAFGGLSAFGGMGSPFGAIGGPTGMFHHFHHTDDIKVFE